MPSIQDKEFIEMIEKRIENITTKIDLFDKESSFIIYPNGRVGKIIRTYLESLGINVVFTIDNNDNNGIDVLSMKDAVSRINHENTYILLCLLNRKLYDEICYPLRDWISPIKIIDLFYEEDNNRVYKFIIEKNELEEIINSLDTYFGKGEYIESPKILELYDRKVTDVRSSIISYVNAKMDRYSACRRKAYALSAFWRKKDIGILDDDILVGRIEKINYMDMCANLFEEINTYGTYCEIKKAFEIGLFKRCPGQHCIPDYKGLINDGVQNTIDKILVQYNKATEVIKRDFYESELILLYEFQKKIIRYAEEAKKKKKYDIGIVLEKIAYKRPEHFIEAVQLLIMAHEAVLDEAGSGSISFGRVDQYLYPFYQKDINGGIISNDFAQIIIDELWRKIANYEMGYQNITLGGGDIEGNDLSNELTIMCMNASIHIESDQPQVSLRVPINGLKQCVWDKAFELIQTGKGFPEIYNDKVAIEAKEYTGVTKEDASDYGIVGCVEISVCGKEYSHTEAARVNLAKLLEVILNQGKCMISGTEWQLNEKRNVDSLGTYDEFEEWIKSELIFFINYVCDVTDLYNKEYAKYYMVPFTSILMEGCIEKAKDVTDCGSRYNNLTLDCVGVASVANSLEAIENIVFKEKRLKLSELVSILNNNFYGAEDIAQRLCSYAKYGNDIDSVDNKAKFIVDIVTNTLDIKNIKYRKGKWQSGFYSSFFHATMGEKTGASADGRKAKEALSSSLSPMAGTDSNGVLAVLNSVNKITMDRFGNGMVLDLKFLPSFWEKYENKKAVQQLICSYFDRGGMEIQFNVVDRKTLLEAKKNPIKYKNLVVRVSGFSAYFITLEENLQDEIIKRTAQIG